MKHGFDNDKYLRIQSEHISERVAQFGNKLYLELGGKLFDDYHASRVLPGFEPDSKLKMLSKLSDRIEIVIVISATDIEKNKVRGDLGITYDMDVLRLRTEFQNRGFMVGSVVITHYNGQSSADAFRAKLERMGIRTYCHYMIDGYPTNVKLIASDEGFGKNDYIETTRPLVSVSIPPSIFRSVVLPAPDSPTTTASSPFFTVKLASAKASISTSPTRYTFLTFSKTT